MEPGEKKFGPLGFSSPRLFVGRRDARSGGQPLARGEGGGEAGEEGRGRTTARRSGKEKGFHLCG